MAGGRRIGWRDADVGHDPGAEEQHEGECGADALDDVGAGRRGEARIPESVRINGAHRPSAIVIQHPASAPVSKPQPVLSGVPLPDWTEPDLEGKPTFFGIDVVDPKPLAGELRRHTYRRDGATALRCGSR